MIIITGANGKLGRAIVENLLELAPSEGIGVSVQDPEKARDLEQRGVRVRRGDYEDPTSLAQAFEGASQVLIVSAPRIGEIAFRLHQAAINAAKAAGAGRILYTSHMGSNSTSHFPPMRTHAATEEALRTSGVPFTSLRNGYYASSATLLLGNALQTGEAAVPEAGPIAWTAHADLAKVAAIVLTKGGLDSISPPLTATETFDTDGVAQIASEITGRPIRRRVVSDDEFRSNLIAHGTPEAGANMLVGVFAASRQGDFAKTDPTLSRLLGQSPTPLRDVLKTTLQTN